MKILKSISLVMSGFLVGTLLTIAFSASSSKTTSRYAINEVKNFVTSFELVKKFYVKPVGDDKLMEGAISGMLAGLDPHSSYLDPETYKELGIQIAGKFGGLGIEVTMDEDGLVKVISPIEGTPADKAGIKPGDVIMKIDDVAVRGLKFTEAINKMRGKPRTKVTLTIARKVENGQEILTVPIVRDIINVVSVKSKMIEPGYGYLRINSFQETTLDSMVEQLTKLQNQTPLKGLILDLRNDPGGILETAVGVSAVFLEPGQLVVSSDGRMPEAKQELYATVDDYLSYEQKREGHADPLAKLDPVFKKIPVVVLVNGGSASASEIVAGALQDHRRALVMGTRTFGKGSVQRVIPLDEQTGIKLTVALYFTPNKRSIQAEGIVPDRIVKDPLNPELGIREADLKDHLDHPEETTSTHKKADTSAMKTDDNVGDQTTADTTDKTAEAKGDIICKPVDKKNRREPVKFGEPGDYQMQQALAALKSSSDFDKNGRPIITAAAVTAKKTSNTEKATKSGK